MSLINEALKKAQRQRQDGTASESGTGNSAGHRAETKSPKSTLLIVAGALVLVVISMVGTALWLTRTPAPTPAAMTQAPIPLPPPTPDKPADLPTISISVPKPVADAQTRKATPSASAPIEPSAAPATPVVSAVATPASAPTASASIPTPVAAAESKPAPKPDERIHKLVESIRVMGIRSSGNESKVLMNDRVYRVNDYVDRALGVRLTKVAPDNLTFTDDNGAVYVKYF